MSWPIVPLGSIADIQLGKMLSPKARTGASSSPYLRNVNVKWGRLDLSDLVEMDFDEEARAKFALKKGDLLVCEGGEPGRSAIVERDLPGVFFQKALMRVRPRDQRLDTRFLLRFMEQAASRGTFAKDGNQATIAHYPAVKLNALEVPLPPIHEQRRIADILGKADAIRRKRKAAIALTEELLRSAFLEMFGDPEQNPKGWTIKPLSDVVQSGTIVTYGIVQAGPHIELGIPYIRTGDIKEGKILIDGLQRTSHEIASKFARSEVRRGDIVMSIRATVGTVALVPEELDGANLTQGTARIAPGASCTQAFLFEHLRSPGTQKWIQTMVKGATFKEITLGALRTTPIMVPPVNLQKRFAQLRSHIGSIRQVNEEMGRRSSILFASLSSKLLGKSNVPTRPVHRN